MTNFKFTAWPTEYKIVTQKFGNNPEYYGQFGLPGHEGVDIRGPHGSEVYAVQSGIVIRAESQDGRHAYGNRVYIEHYADDGVFETVYAHLDRFTVFQGQEVSAGELIGYADNTGNSFGSHLHLTLKKRGEEYEGYPLGIIDPTPYLEELLQPAYPAFMVVSNGSNTNYGVNVRSKPIGGTESKIGWLRNGSIVELVTKPKLVNDYIQVKWPFGNGGIAWMYYSMLK